MADQPTRHPTTIPGFASLQDAANYIGNMRYDALRDFVDALEAKLMSDSNADQARGRGMLSATLHNARMSLGHARLDLDYAWKISEPHMSGEVEK